MTMTLPPIDVDLSALATRLDHVPERPLSLAECQTLKAVVHMFADVLRLLDEQGATIAQLRAFLGWARSEKMREVLRQAGLDPQTTSAPRVDESRPATGQARQHPDPGHGRHGAAAYAGAHKIAIAHAALHPGDACPGCATGKVYAQQEPRRLIRIVGQAPLAATVYALERLRCNLCGEVFTATPPEGVGAEKYDATSASMIALLKYGSGLPFHRLERLQAHLAIPLPASTQWEIVAETATVLRPTLDELVRQAAQGDVLHNDDTHMRVLGLRHEAAPAASGTEEAPIDPANAGPDMAKRTGVFTSGIVSQTQDGHRIALFFTGRRHAGENLAAVLARRAAELGPPIQMSDALTRNLPEPLQVIVANCLAHGRRRFVEVTPQFPAQCRHVLEALGEIYGHDAHARAEGMTPEARLQYHQAHSGPVMTALHAWLTAQLAEKQVEPNSGLGKAITYLLKHWPALTLFLRQPGAPLDNSLCERALKKAILHRKNALFYKTMNGAQVGDLFMSLIHTCELNGVNPFDYLTELQRHAEEMARNPAEWMPWNYRETLARASRSRSETGPGPLTDGSPLLYLYTPRGD